MSSAAIFVWHFKGNTEKAKFANNVDGYEQHHLDLHYMPSIFFNSQYDKSLDETFSEILQT